MRVLIIGSPRSGKTTLGKQLGTILDVKPQHADDLQGLEWSEASEQASTWFDAKGSLVIEGTMAVRALRKWLKRNPSGMPVDVVVYRDEALEDLRPGQASMGKGVRTVFEEIKPELARRNVRIVAV